MTAREFIGDWSPQVKKEFSERVEGLLLRCPSDATEKTHFERRGDVCFGDVSFHSSQGIFSGRCFDKDIAKVLDVICRTIESQIKEWHYRREILYFEPEEPKFANKSVLVVDDDGDSARLLERGIKKLGCSVQTVSDATQACIELARKSFDLIFLDWVMPDINGGDTLKRAEKIITGHPLYTNKYLQHETPVVIYSSEDMERLDGIPESTIFKFIDHWKKPYQYKNIVSRLPQVLAAT